jgi:hypothetical protein
MLFCLLLCGQIWGFSVRRSHQSDYQTDLVTSEPIDNNLNADQSVLFVFHFQEIESSRHERDLVWFQGLVVG